MNEMTTIDRTQREYSDAASKALARKPQLFINGEWVDQLGRQDDRRRGSLHRARSIAKFVDATDEDVDRAVAAARTAFDDGRWRGLPPIAREKHDPQARRPARSACRRVRRARSDRQRQAQGHGRARSTCPAPIGAAPLHGRLGQQDRRRDVDALRDARRARCSAIRLPRAGRRLRADRAVELPAADGAA